ncbi:formate/nitrite transporter family protein [Clostridium sp. CCUG 7971]|uniref:formate/nitrite transporter family protein n=1 Tax=Clostridium sp. CCUG 7971 TaxID=2811414 RepID=UPI001ABAA82D|nr:formate/nitrite transporter family protein [Clostridium sp. CCUG 7971]MBO3444657.1 formate/nitrite transporter family protein [Clostridium sp. CCUG 7971]
MDKRFLTPGEIAEAIVNVNIKRAGLDTKPCLLLGVLAGIFIGLGGLGNIIFTQTLAGIDPGLAKFAGGVVFPVGLMLVVMCGAELFTGNNLMSLAVMEKKISMGQMFRNWGLVYIANFIGSLFLVLLVFYSSTLTGDAATKAIAITESKVALTFSEAFFKGILCNILVVLAVWMATAAQDVVSKIFACWFPVMLFVLCGFEHSVANMFFIPMGMSLGADVGIAQLIMNLIPVTLGNIVGGAIIIPFMYRSCYLNKKVKKTEKVR